MTSKIKFYGFKPEPKTVKQRLTNAKLYLQSALETVQDRIREGQEVSIKLEINDKAVSL